MIRLDNISKQHGHQILFIDASMGLQNSGPCYGEVQVPSRSWVAAPLVPLALFIVGCDHVGRPGADGEPSVAPFISWRFAGLPGAVSLLSTASPSYKRACPGRNQCPINLRIVIERPVVGVLHTLSGRADIPPLDPKARARASRSSSIFSAPFCRPQIPRRPGAGKVRCGALSIFASARCRRRFLALVSRMKIDIHDVGNDLLDRAANGGGVIETTVIGTSKDGISYVRHGETNAAAPRRALRQGRGFSPPLS